jgi:hypothetical protein
MDLDKQARAMGRVCATLLNKLAPEEDRAVAGMTAAAMVMDQFAQGCLQPTQIPRRRDKETPEQYLHFLAKLDHTHASYMVTLAWVVTTLRANAGEAEADELERQVRAVYRISETGWPADGWERREWAMRHARERTRQAREGTGAMMSTRRAA